MVINRERMIIMNGEENKSLNMNKKKLMQNIVEISKYKRKLNDLSPENEKIKDLKRLISNDQYQIDTKKLAEKILS
jgi:anti-sigma28 factor (negative regulator of flagellin synthesis)